MRTVITERYGSVARGARDARDIDLLAISAARAENEKARDLVMTRTERISRRYGMQIGLVVVAASDLGSASYRPLVVEVKDDAVLLVGAAPRPLAGIGGAGLRLTHDKSLGRAG